MFVVLFLGVLSLFVCSLVSVGLYALLLVHNVSAYTSTHFHVTTSTYLGLVVAMLQHLPLYSPRVYNSRIISLVIVVEFISRVIYLYAFEFTADIALWVKKSHLQTNHEICRLHSIWLGVCIWYGITTTLRIHIHSSKL